MADPRTKAAATRTYLTTRATAAVSPTLARRPAGRLWFTPWPVGTARSREREREWLAGTTPMTFNFRPRGTTSARAQTLPGFAAGDGPTVLLVHGWGMRGASLGAAVHPLVEAGYRVIGVDLPAHGRAPGLVTDAYELADALVSVARQVGPVHAVIAHSMGAVVTSLALRRGLGIERAVLLAPASNLEHALDTFARQMSLPRRTVTAIRGAIESRFGRQVWTELTVARFVGAFTAPVLIAHDVDDDQVDITDSESLAAAWPGSRMVVTSGLGHNRIMSNPAVIAAAIAHISGTATSGDEEAGRSPAIAARPVSPRRARRSRADRIAV